MDLERKKYKTTLEGSELSLEVSRLAGKANAAVLGQHGDTVVLTTVVMGDQDKPLDYFPLTVDYEERFYAVGKILGSRFIRRESRPSEEAILSARLIDRTIRPLFDQRLRREVQVTITILSYDEKTDPDALALIATSAALHISDIPWNGPVGGVKLQRESNGKPTLAFFAGPKDRINMIEFEGVDVPSEEALKIFEDSQKIINSLVDFQEKVRKEIGKPKTVIALADTDPRVKSLIRDFVTPELASAVKNKTLNDLKSKLFKHLEVSGEDSGVIMAADNLFEDEINEFVHSEMLEHDRRPDGRKADELRDLYGEVGLLKRTHGSGLFIRGDTQILAVTTLATPDAEQLVETMRTAGHKRFMLHYNFPNFSTGEVGRSRGPGRREIGHGKLAEKAVKAIIPEKIDFPYTIRVVAETLSSNGSSSMASACAASLSLMDAGVPIKKHVAGIAMGLMLDSASGKYKVLTDIQGPEDHHGDMDLKIAGTEDGVTAIQMDVKMEGITKEIFKDTLIQAERARIQIIKVMKSVIEKPRPKVSPFAPTIIVTQIRPEKIGTLIGSGGKTINGIVASFENKISIDIEEDGRVYVASTDPEMAKKAMVVVEQTVKEFAVGEIVEGNIIKVLDFGAIVDLGAGQDGMIHVSELKEGFVKKVEDVVKLGAFVRAKVIKVENGKIGLSIKALQEK